MNLVVTAGKNPEEILYEVNTFRNVVKEMVVQLRSVKPIRPPKRELQVAPHIEFTLV